MEQVALTLSSRREWTYLGGDADARKDLEVVVRAFDVDVEFALGSDADAPDDTLDGTPVRVPAGEGRRLVGRHFFVRTATPTGGAGRITYRGI